MTAAIIDMKFRCKVIRHLISNSVSEMPFGGVYRDFFVEGEIYKFSEVHY